MHGYRYTSSENTSVLAALQLRTRREKLPTCWATASTVSLLQTTFSILHTDRISHWPSWPYYLYDLDLHFFVLDLHLFTSSSTIYASTPTFAVVSHSHPRMFSILTLGRKHFLIGAGARLHLLSCPHRAKEGNLLTTSPAPLRIYFQLRHYGWDNGD